MKKVFTEALDSAAKYYKRYLPKPVAATFPISGSLLRNISALVGPIRILGARREVIQDFYMYFAQGVYRWDLAQYFTPSEVVDFIVTLVNPQAGDQIKDPACGSGDFLISAFHHANRNDADIRSAIWGADSSENAVQVCVLNMVLNGDGKGQIRREDSLATMGDDQNWYSAMLCNPPFGVKILERQFDVLKQFDLGREWNRTGSELHPTTTVLKNQQVGLLFAELCVRQVASGGRVGIILPNGYLGNRGPRYVAFREWLLRHTRLVAVIAFPRFTFKKSGADVSASVVILEKRETPLARALDSEDYPFYAGILESVGWSVSDKSAEPIYKRDPATGVQLTNSDNEPILDADFDRILQDLWSSPVTDLFPWIKQGGGVPGETGAGWATSIRNVVARDDLSIDPKRWCERAVTTRNQITGIPHFRLGDVADVIPQGGLPANKSDMYEHVRLEFVSDGVITPERLRGWQLPDRARHTAERGDIFVGNIWSSIGKWFVAGGDSTRLVVSNGFHRLRLKAGKEDHLTDLVAALNTEAYRIQARSFATGSDGLAELPSEDLLEIVIPRVTNETARATMQQLIDALLAGRATVASVVATLLEQGKLTTATVQSRSSNWVQV